MAWLSCIISNLTVASLLAVAACFVQRRLGRPAAARFLWVLVLVKLVTPPLVSVPLGASTGTMACALGTCGCGPHSRTQAFLLGTFPVVLLAVWTAGVAVTLLAALVRWTRFRRLIAHARPVPPEWQSLAARLSSELSMRRPPEILAVPGRLPPLVVPGRSRPRMLLPMELMERLNESQREALLLHELVHIQRGDHLVRLLELMVRAAYWWLPLVASITRQLRACEETYCDRAVVAHRPRSRRDYALLLLDVVDFASPLPRHTIPQATPLSAAEGLEQRLGAILDAAPRRRRTSPTGALVVGLACAILPCGLQLDIRANDSAGRDSVRQPGPSRPSAEREPAAEAAARPRVNREVELQAMCCPS